MQLKEMQQHKQLLPWQYTKIIKELDGWKEYLELAYDKVDSGEFIRSKADKTTVGYYMLPKEDLQKFFQPIFNELGKDIKVKSGYIHYVMKGGKCADHTHDLPHAVYYLQAPENSGELTFKDYNHDESPERFKFFLIPANVWHGIRIHRNNVYRVAITIQMEAYE